MAWETYRLGLFIEELGIRLIHEAIVTHAS